MYQVTSFDQLNSISDYYFSSTGLLYPFPSNVDVSHFKLSLTNVSNFTSNANYTFDPSTLTRISFYDNYIYFYGVNDNYLSSFNLNLNSFSFDFNFVGVNNQGSYSYDLILHESIYGYTELVEEGLVSNYLTMVTNYTGLSIGVVASIISAIALLVLVFKRG